MVIILRKSWARTWSFADFGKVLSEEGRGSFLQSGRLDLIGGDPNVDHAVDGQALDEVRLALLPKSGDVVVVGNHELKNTIKKKCNNWFFRDLASHENNYWQNNKNKQLKIFAATFWRAVLFYPVSLRNFIMNDHLLSKKLACHKQ